MPWCPICKNEYVEGKTHCPDCDVDLVEELSQEPEEPLKVPEDYTFPEDFDPREILEEAKREPVSNVPLYKQPEERYQDMHSSAWTFLAVGAAGILVMILCWLGVIRLPLHNFALFIMTALFVIFLGIGVVSFQSARKLKAGIASENAFVEEVIAWYRATGCHAPALSELDKSQPEELLYFQRSEIIRSVLREQFPEIDPSLLEKLTDDFCEEDFSG